MSKNNEILMLIFAFLLGYLMHTMCKNVEGQDNGPTQNNSGDCDPHQGVDWKEGDPEMDATPQFCKNVDDPDAQGMACGDVKAKHCYTVGEDVRCKCPPY